MSSEITRGERERERLRQGRRERESDEKVWMGKQKF